MTPHDVLGVRPQASEAEITAAYRVLAQIFHPDRFADCADDVRRTAELRMVRLNDAYAVLKRKGGARRRAMSAWRASGGDGPSGPAGPVTTVPWEQSAAQRAAEAIQAQRKREAQERQSRNGRAIERAKPRIPLPLVVYGLGEALHTNNTKCRGCSSVEWFPDGWKDRLALSDFFCSGCGRALLTYRPRE